MVESYGMAAVLLALADWAVLAMNNQLLLNTSYVIDSLRVECLFALSV